MARCGVAEAAVVGEFAVGETGADAPAGRGAGEMGMRRNGKK
jgi:hypothetical protein